MHHFHSNPEQGSGSDEPAKLLVVDDSASTRMLMKDILSRGGKYLVEEAGNGLEALDLLKTNKYDLIISDIRMPGMDGISLLEKIRESYGSLPVIMVTGFGSEIGPRTLELGADDCIYLPFKVEEFMFRVARVLRFHQLLQVRELLIEQNRELWGRAITDQLTGLYNRHYFDDVFTAEFERARRYQIHLGCIMFDIDHFKRVNDVYGHLVGDRVLMEIGVLVTETIRRVDIASRYGGEEFVVILPETDQEGTLFVANRLRESVEAFTFAQGELKDGEELPVVTISIGVVHYPDERFTSATQMLKMADDKLYQAKNNGRNRVEIAW